MFSPHITCYINSMRGKAKKRNVPPVEACSLWRFVPFR